MSERSLHRTEAIAGKSLGHLREAFVDPPLFVGVTAPVECVLKLVGQCSQVARSTHRQRMLRFI